MVSGLFGGHGRHSDSPAACFLPGVPWSFDFDFDFDCDCCGMGGGAFGEVHTHKGEVRMILTEFRNKTTDLEMKKPFFVKKEQKFGPEWW